MTDRSNCIKFPLESAPQLCAPPAGGNVWPRQSCPAFSARSGLCEQRECWFCCYADFHLRQRIALDVGVCCWPQINLQ